MNIILFDTQELGKPLARRDERAIHLIKVLHKKQGDTFDAGIIGGSTGTGKIESIRFDGAIFYTLDLKNEAQERFPLYMAVGFPRPIQLRRILRDLTCLGVKAIDLVNTELGEKSYRDTKMLKDGGAVSAMLEGAVQARDTTLPDFSIYDSLTDWLTQRPWEKYIKQEIVIGRSKINPQLNPLLLAADNVRPEGSFANLKTNGESLVVALGSERGWSDNERDRLENAGFLRLSMGERALRTDTACIAAAVLSLEKMGVL